MSSKPLRSLRWLAGALMLAGVAWAGGAPFDFTHHGHFQRMMHTGQTAGQVALSALPQPAGTWGVGATAGLKGEIIQIDGRLLVSPGSDEQGRVRPPQDGEPAVLFASGRVQAWQDVAVPRDMDAAAFESWRATDLSDDGAGVVPDALVVGIHGWVLTADGSFVSNCSWYDDPSPGGPLPASVGNPRRLDGRCAVVASEWGGENFGHFLSDTLPRLHLLEASGLLDGDVDHYLLPPLGVPEARDLLARTGIDPARIVWLEPGGCVTAPEVLATTYPGERRTTPTWVPRYLRQRFADARPGGAEAADQPRRIYLARGENSRRPVDERAVAEALAEFGFVTVDCDETRGNSMFATAEIVVGPNGAALTNTLFCRPGTTLVELVPSDHPFPFFLSTSLAAGLDYVGFGCPSTGEREPGDPAPSRFDFTVDVDALCDLISELVSESR